MSSWGVDMTDCITSMEFVLWKVLAQISDSDDQSIKKLIVSESSRLEITKSLLNVLHNIVRTRTIHLSNRQKNSFTNFTDQVHQILGKKSLGSKRRILLANPGLAKLIAKSCPRPSESFSSAKMRTND